MKIPKALLKMISILFICTSAVLIKGDRTKVCITCCTDAGNCVIICED